MKSNKKSPAPMTSAELARALEVTPQAVTKWRHAGCPVEPGGQAFRLAAVVAWLVDRERAKLEETMASGESRDRWEKARADKTEHEARLAGLVVAEKEGTLIHVDIHRACVAELADNLRAVLVNAPSNYVVDLERVGVPPKDAQDVLQRIMEDLTGALRGAPVEVPA